MTGHQFWLGILVGFALLAIVAWLSSEWVGSLKAHGVGQDITVA